MKDRCARFLGLVSMLAASFAPFLPAQTVGRHTGQDVKIIDLVSHPDPMVLEQPHGKRSFMATLFVLRGGGLRTYSGFLE